MKDKVITLAIVPVVLAGCEDNPDRHRTRINEPQRVYVQNNQAIYTQNNRGVYYRCPNGRVVAEGQSCAKSSSSGTGGGGTSRSSDDADVKRGGFGSKSGKAGG